MAWPMVEWVLDTRYAHLHRTQAYVEKSVIVFGAMEAALTPLMVRLEAEFSGIKVFSLPSVATRSMGGTLSWASRVRRGMWPWLTP